ncbi:MAG: hypothetical protein ACRD2G_07170 [Terriglobia bacterium]
MTILDCNSAAELDNDLADIRHTKIVAAYEFDARQHLRDRLWSEKDIMKDFTLYTLVENFVDDGGVSLDRQDVMDAIIANDSELLGNAMFSALKKCTDEILDSNAARAWIEDECERLAEDDRA